jgi:hypothetical protein
MELKYSTVASSTEERISFSFFPIGTRVYFYVDSVMSFCFREENISGSLLVEDQDKYVDMFETLFKVYASQIYNDAQFSQSFLESMMSRRAQSIQDKRKSVVDVASLFVDSIIEHAVSFAFDSRVHTCVLLILITPSLHWRIRENIWKQLGSLGLLHLLESPSTALFMANILKVRETNISVIRYMVIALKSLRSTEDRTWIICRMALYHIASFTLGNSSESASSKLRQVGLREGDNDPIVSWIYSSVLVVQNSVADIEACLSVTSDSYGAINAHIERLFRDLPLTI